MTTTIVLIVVLAAIVLAACCLKNEIVHFVREDLRKEAR